MRSRSERKLASDGRFQDRRSSPVEGMKSILQRAAERADRLS